MNAAETYNGLTRGDLSPYAEQAEVFDRLYELRPGEPLLIRLPCGYGKTEAVVFPFLAQAVEKKWPIAPRLIYVLPTRALCNQIADRIRKAVERSSLNLVVGVEHGTASLDPLFFGDVCVTTFDQLLYGYARAKPQVGRHLDLPAGAIANSIVVFDEAHLYSPYTHSLLRAMIEILCVSRIPVVAMTATMPKSLEGDLFEGLDTQSKRVEFWGQWPAHLANREVNWRCEDWCLLDGEAVSPQLSKLLKEQAKDKVLIVVNRVDTAQRLAKALEKRKPVLIHSRFKRCDRDVLEVQIAGDEGKGESGLLGKGAKSPALVISTQVCEVGLDISADVLITECASADALVQRAGRLARWGGHGKMIVVPSADQKADSVEWNKAFPYVDPKVEQGEYAGLAWQWLQSHTDCSDLFTDWDRLTELCNTMQYHTDDIEARGALGQLFDATLYADERPWNLSARGDLYCTVAVVPPDWLKPKRGQKETPLNYQELKDRSMNVPFFWLKKRLPDKGKGVALYDFDKRGFEPGTVKPFTIIGVEESGMYSEALGLELPSPNPEDTEEAASCVIV